ncbi:MAG TPA: hypothetical protein VFV43_03760 [Limnobacter sp.]|nr:hypothetical protein [Limnobacter sp.]
MFSSLLGSRTSQYQPVNNDPVDPNMLRASHAAMTSWYPDACTMKHSAQQLVKAAKSLGNATLHDSGKRALLHSDNLECYLEIILKTYGKDIKRLDNLKSIQQFGTGTQELETFKNHVRHSEAAIASVLSPAEAFSCQYNEVFPTNTMPVADAMAHLGVAEQRSKAGQAALQSAQNLQMAARGLLQKIRVPAVASRVGPISQDRDFYVDRYRIEQANYYHPVEH